MTSTIDASLLEKVIQLREQLADTDPQQRFNAFRAQLKQNDITVAAPRASELWKAAGQAIQQKQSAAAMAAPANGPSEETQDGPGLGKPEEENQEEMGPPGEEEDDVQEGINPPPVQEEEEFYSLDEIKENHLYPYDDAETFADFEERVAQGCSFSHPAEREAVEAYALEILGDAVSYLECRSQGMSLPQIRFQLKRMQLAPQETPVGLAMRYRSLIKAYVRMGGPGNLEDCFKTKARLLLTNAGLPVSPWFEGPEQSMSTDSPRGETFATPEGRMPPRSP